MLSVGCPLPPHLLCMPIRYLGRSHTVPNNETSRKNDRSDNYGWTERGKSRTCLAVGSNRRSRRNIHDRKLSFSTARLVSTYAVLT